MFFKKYCKILCGGEEVYLHEIMSSAPGGNKCSVYVKAAVIPMNKYLGIHFIGGSVETRPHLEILEKENVSIRAEDPTHIPLSLYPYPIQYAD